MVHNLPLKCYVSGWTKAIGLTGKIMGDSGLGYNGIGDIKVI